MDTNENEGKEKKLGILGILRSAGPRKSYWWIQIVFLLIFLAGGGIYFAIVSGKAAHKLVGGDSYTDLSSGAKHGFFGDAVVKFMNYFAAEENAQTANQTGAGKNDFSSENQAEKNALDNLDSADASGTGSDGSQGVGSAKQAGLGSRSSTGAGSMQRLIPKSSSVLADAGGKPQTSGLGSFGGASAGRPSFERTDSRQTRASKPVSGTKHAALEGLKGAYKANLYGARIASNDAARNWTARSFDGASEASSAIKYDEKMKRELDRINPNSIPQYLRDQDLSGADSIQTPNMEKPKETDEGNDPSEKDSLTKDMMKNMMGSMLGGGSGMGGETSGDDKNTTTNPNDNQNLNDTSTGSPGGWCNESNTLCYPPGREPWNQPGDNSYWGNCYNHCVYNEADDTIDCSMNCWT